MALNSNSKDKRSKRLLLGAIALLFVLNAFFIYQLFNKSNELKTTTIELQSTEAELAQVNELKAELETELEKYIGQNAKLDSVISVRDAEIQQKVRRIQQMLQSGNVTKSELAKAKGEIDKLRSQVDLLTKEIEELSKENQYLKDENYVMQKKIEAEQEKVSEMEGVIRERDQQVAVGSRIFLKSLKATPLRDALVGDKFKSTDKLSRMDKLEVSYTLGNNDLAKEGERTLYFQIVTPNKSVLVSGNAGGTLNTDGGERLYTLKKVVNFRNSNESGSFSIPKSESMQEGKYTVTVYGDDHIMGTTTFNLR
jgi:myosin heavy subunit